MLFITDLENISLIEKYNVDGFIVNSKEFSCYNGKTFVKDEIIDVINKVKELGKVVYLNVDKLLLEDEINEFKEYLNFIDDHYDYLIFSDMATLNIIDQSNYCKLLYDPKTLVCSSFEANRLNEIGVNSFIANELSKEELKMIGYQMSNQHNEFNMMVYGYVQMMYSKRKLFTLYNDFRDLGINLKDRLLYLKEELRDEIYLGYQSDNGAFIYSDYIYCCFKELYELKNNLNILRFNHMFINSIDMIKVIDLYHKLIDEKEDSNFLFQELVSINQNISSGFLNKESILLKGDNNE